ncbi:MAG: hypothetical protein KDB53_09570 [Planctomycetes bacterium]|nr:hypothetical protein [Planctomycetota bacterium]
MKNLTLTIGLTALVATGAMAQGGGRGEGRGFNPERMAGFLAPSVIRLADKDADGAVAKDEWTGFLSSVKADDTHVDLAKIETAMTRAALDVDNNGKLEIADLDAAFKQLDGNADGKLATDELNPTPFGGRGQGRRPRGGEGEEEGDDAAPRRRRPDQADGERPGGRGQGAQDRARRVRIAPQMRTLVAKADKNSDDSVTAEEWSAFKLSLANDEGKVDEAKFLAAAAAPAKTDEKDDEGPGRGRRGMRDMGAMIKGWLDPEGTGKVETATLQKAFADLDKDSDGALGKEELNPRRGGRGGRGGERPGRDI